MGRWDRNELRTLGVSFGEFRAGAEEKGGDSAEEADSENKTKGMKNVGSQKMTRDPLTRLL